VPVGPSDEIIEFQPGWGVRVFATKHRVESQVGGSRAVRRSPPVHLRDGTLVRRSHITAHLTDNQPTWRSPRSLAPLAPLLGSIKGLLSVPQEGSAYASGDPPRAAGEPPERERGGGGAGRQAGRGGGRGGACAVGCGGARRTSRSRA
jgi:hypothetical protein